MTVTTTAPYDRLCTLLQELFQFDQEDLDFGIYRIMNQRRAEVERFLRDDLLPQVRQALGTYQAGQRTALEARAQQIREQAQQLRLPDPAVLPDWQEVQDELARLGDEGALESEVYSDLYRFFRRYYKDGDFLSLRRYKDGIYAIPYEGEEVKLHWANADQYYVKTTERFQDYRFVLADGRAVRFRLIAGEGERDNNKAAEGRERRFVLHAAVPVEVIDGELHLLFVQQPSAERQNTLNAEAINTILVHPSAALWLPGLGVLAPTKANPGRTLLARRLDEYTKRNSFDYFIHKDLGGFLRRELDFFLTSEIVQIDDLDGATPERVVGALARLRAIRQIGGKIIAFLAQLEDFQKRLFLKKKFVLGGGGAIVARYYKYRQIYTRRSTITMPNGPSGIASSRSARARQVPPSGWPSCTNTRTSSSTRASSTMTSPTPSWRRSMIWTSAPMGC